MNQLNPQLWQRFTQIAQGFLKIAQPYFYPLQPRSSLVFVGLLMLLIGFLFTTMFLLIATVTLTVQSIFPEVANSIAPGLSGWITSILFSPLGYFLGIIFVTAILSFILCRGELVPRWQTWLLLGLLLFLSLSVSLLNVVISYVGNFFTTALAEKDQTTFWRFLFVYAGVFVIGTPIVVTYTYTREKLGLLWREWMTSKFLSQYFKNRAYYEINSDPQIDNPDQRVSEDIKSFTRTSLSFLLIILGAIIDVISFTGILWMISKKLSIFLILYAVVGTLITLFIGKRLIHLNFNQLRREADFRYGLVHIRDHAESIAFYRGELQEKYQVKQRFMDAFQNFNLLIGWQRNVDYFTTSYRYAVVILPSLIMAPIYFSGEIRYGDITQANIAFSQVLAAFSVVVNQIEQLSAFAAGIERLSSFSDALESAGESDQQPQDNPEKSMIESIPGPELCLEKITLETPKHQKTLIQDLCFTLEPEQGLLIIGQSGVGKSSLLRAIAGLWHTGAGTVIRPSLREMMFLPQRPYMILGNLRDQLLYPNTDLGVSETELESLFRHALKMVNLPDLPERVGGFDIELDWADVLSLGEQQRLAFARLLLTQPRYAILDEATSALDLKNEASLYQYLRSSRITFVSVGHRSSLLQYHHHVLELMGDTTWRLLPVTEYVADSSMFT